MDTVVFSRQLCSLTYKPKEEWTHCTFFRCVMNTGWAAGDDKYLCRAALDVKTCGAVPKPPKK